MRACSARGLQTDTTTPLQDVLTGGQSDLETQDLQFMGPKGEDGAKDPQRKESVFLLHSLECFSSPQARVGAALRVAAFSPLWVEGS